jgi:hypothetical protein
MPGQDGRLRSDDQGEPNVQVAIPLVDSLKYKTN